MTVTADPFARLVPAADEQAAATARRRRFAALLALAFFLHVALFALLLYGSRKEDAAPTIAEEIPVDIVAELPPEPKVEPPAPPLPPKREPPKPKLLQDDMKPAFDAPRDANKETVEREAPDKTTQAQRAAPPTQQTAEKPAPTKSAVKETAPDPSPRHAPDKVAEEKQDENAEALAKAETKETAKSKDRQAKRDPVKTPPSQGRPGSIADQLAALSPSPNYSVASRAKPAPIAGGTENTTYLSILYGLIMRQWRDPPGSTIRALAAEGIVVFYVDETGNITHQALARASGRPDLDSAAAMAVRRAAPFPAPPRGMPRSIAFHYGTK